MSTRIYILSNTFTSYMYYHSLYTQTYFIFTKVWITFLIKNPSYFFTLCPFMNTGVTFSPLSYYNGDTYGRMTIGVAFNTGRKRVTNCYFTFAVPSFIC